MANPLLHNYLVEFIGSNGLTSMNAEVEAPDSDRAKTQMLGELEKRGFISHKQRGKVRKDRGLGDNRLRVKMVEKGTSGAKISIPWIQEGETTTNLMMPKPNIIPQPKLKSIEPSPSSDYTGEQVSAPPVEYGLVGVALDQASLPEVAPQSPDNTTVDLGTDYGGPLEQVFGHSPIMDVSRKSGGK
jgi:hypothetical protein